MKKRATDNNIFQTNLLQALQKNKTIQSRLSECQSSYYVQLLKDMQVYHLQEKYNRELLYTWKKESYIRQLKKNLQEYKQKRSGVKDAYYEIQLKNLDNIITGQQTLVIPPSEEERRLTINAKYEQFLQKNPLQALSSPRFAKSAVASTNRNKNEIDNEEENVPILYDPSKHIHAQSATILTRKTSTMFPSVRHRSSTTHGIRRKKGLTRSHIPSSAAAVSNVHVGTTPEIVTSSSDEKFQRSPRSPIKSAPNYLGLPDDTEPLFFTSESLDRYTRADLVTMRSVRRPRQSPTDLNLIFETRKRIYQINKEALDHQILSQKIHKLPTNMHFDPPKRIDPANTIENALDNINKNHDKHDNINENHDKHDNINENHDKHDNINENHDKHDNINENHDKHDNINENHDKHDNINENHDKHDNINENHDKHDNDKKMT